MAIYVRIYCRRCRFGDEDRAKSLVSLGQSLLVLVLLVFSLLPLTYVYTGYRLDSRPVNEYPLNVVFFVSQMLPPLAINFVIPGIYFLKNKNIRTAMLREAKDVLDEILERAWYDVSR